MKKLLISLCVLATVIACALTATACGSSTKAKIIPIALSDESYGIAVKKGDTATAELVNGVLNSLTGDGVQVNGKTVTFSSIYDEEIAAQEKGEVISIGNVKTVSTNRSNEFVVVTNAEFAPFEYMVGDSFGGIDMQVAKIIADTLGKELVIKHVSFETVLNELEAGNADVAMAGLTINEERLETVDFSVPYYKTAQYLAVLETNTDFDNCQNEADVVAVLKGLTNVKAGAATAQTGYFYLTGNEAFEFDGYDNIQTTAYPSIALAVQDLVNGSVQIVCGDKDPLTAAVNAINK